MTWVEIDIQPYSTGEYDTVQRTGQASRVLQEKMSTLQHQILISMI